MNTIIGPTYEQVVQMRLDWGNVIAAYKDAASVHADFQRKWFGNPKKWQKGWQANQGDYGTG